MKADIWQTNFGGNIQTHCRLVIEEITITGKQDIKRAKELIDTTIIMKCVKLPSNTQVTTYIKKW